MYHRLLYCKKRLLVVMAMLQILMLMFLILAPEVLVLKNGKKITCRSYEVEGGRVTVVGKQKFSLPESAIDWARTKKEKERRAKAAAEKAKKKQQAAVEAAAAEEKPKKTIRLTNEDYQKIAGPRLSGAAVIPYRSMGNHVLVSVAINGGGPYDFVLDTGAETTVISPQAAGEMGLELSNPVTVHGVGGVTTAYTTKLSEVALGNARVRNLRVAVNAIPILNQRKVVGLLGQDYLNHFVMELDPAGQRLTPTPHGSGNAGEQEDIMERLKNPREGFNQMGELSGQIGRLYHHYMSAGPGGDYTGEQAQLRRINQEIPRVIRKVDGVRSAVSSVDQESIPTDKKEQVRMFLHCYPTYKRLVGEIQSLSDLLARAYNRTRDAESMTKMKANLKRKYEEANRREREFRRCSQ